MSQYSDSTFTEDPNSSWLKAYNYITPKSEVLDIGCSSGTFGAVLIKKKSCSVDGIELDEGDFKQAQKNLQAVYKLNIESDNLSVIHKKYDFIYFGDVIEHLVNPVATLKKVKSLLKSNGKVIFSIPNMSHISVRLMLLSGDFNYGKTGLLDTTHLHFYTHQEVQRVFADSGYAISDMNPVLKDYPREILKKELNKVGLALTQKFIDFAASTEASVYQFVGVAKPTTEQNQKSKELDLISPVDKFQQYLDETREYYKEIINSNRLHIVKQDKLLKTLSVENSQLSLKNDELTKLSGHRLGRVIKKYRTSGNNK
jgi:2-polyprenyl-3-methyl-5-hydroxy-6-metoxy-1,4-benzoquinol methylase